MKKLLLPFRFVLKILRTAEGKFFDLIEWDVKNFHISFIVAFFLMLAGINMPHIWTWQYWTFLFGAIILTLSCHIRGVERGKEWFKKSHEEQNVCIPKAVLIKQAQQAQEVHEAMHHHHEQEEEKLEEDKLPN